MSAQCTGRVSFALFSCVRQLTSSKANSIDVSTKGKANRTRQVQGSPICPSNKSFTPELKHILRLGTFDCPIIFCV